MINILLPLSILFFIVWAQDFECRYWHGTFFLVRYFSFSSPVYEPDFYLDEEAGPCLDEDLF